MEVHAATAVVAAETTSAAQRGRANDRVGALYVATALVLFAVLGLLGLTMRLTQADVLGVSPEWFYRILTVHGAGMLTAALLAVMGALWYVLRDLLPLSAKRSLAAYGCVVGGAVLVVAAAFLGGFATGWTFLWPLPFKAAGEWSTFATALYLVGLAAVGAGFEIFCLEMLSAATRRYGSLTRAYGIDFLLDRDDDPPPPQIIAATVIGVVGLLALAVGVVIIAAELSRTVDTKMTIDALWAKNLTYFFGHSLANLIIYLGAGVIYALLPRFAGRPWKTTKPLAIGWCFTTLFVIFAYSHHLYMDFVQPRGMEVAASVASFGAALPVAVVTVYTGLMLVWGSKYRWTLSSTLLYLGFAGWLIGGSAAVIDSLIPANFKLHNTLWVPAHFHTYLMLGVMLWVMAFAAYLLERAAGQIASRQATIAATATMLIGGYGLVGAWYVSGLLGIPRRYAVTLGDTTTYSLVGGIFAAVFAVGFLILLGEFARLGRLALKRHRARMPATFLPDQAPAAPPPEPAPQDPVSKPLPRQVHVGIAIAAATVSLLALAPPVFSAVGKNVQWHHVQHAALLFLGGMVALIAVSRGHYQERLGQRGIGWGYFLAIVAPVVAMLAMTPKLYEPLEGSGILHFGYHLIFIALGGLTGWGAARLGRVPAVMVVLVTTLMAAIYAMGVSGG